MTEPSACPCSCHVAIHGAVRCGLCANNHPSPESPRLPDGHVCADGDACLTKQAKDLLHRARERTAAESCPEPIRLTVEQVLAILPSLEREPSYPLTVTEALNVAAREAELTTPRRMAAFLAQVVHESGEFRWLVEKDHRKPVAGCRMCTTLANIQALGKDRDFPWHVAGAQYEGRADLGNTEPGDGVRYKGRGPIQLTGRANYRAAGKALGEPLEQQPELAARLDVGMRVAAWYWRARHCNEPADAGGVVAVTRKVNGGTNGLEQRRAYYERALRVLESKQ